MVELDSEGLDRKVAAVLAPVADPDVVRDILLVNEGAIEEDIALDVARDELVEVHGAQDRPVEGQARRIDAVIDLVEANAGGRIGGKAPHVSRVVRRFDIKLHDGPVGPCGQRPTVTAISRRAVAVARIIQHVRLRKYPNAVGPIEQLDRCHRALIRQARSDRHDVRGMGHGR